MRSGAKWCAIPARRLIRIFLGIALAALAAAGVPARAQSSSQQLPSFAELEAAGARIGRIPVVTQDMFLVTDIETYANQRMAGVAGVTGWSNRVTHVFRREGGEWRLVHRHANRLEAQYEPAARLKPGSG